jgi:hypothetical protein
MRVTLTISLQDPSKCEDNCAHARDPNANHAITFHTSTFVQAKGHRIMSGKFERQIVNTAPHYEALAVRRIRRIQPPISSALRQLVVASGLWVSHQHPSDFAEHTLRRSQGPPLGERCQLQHCRGSVIAARMQPPQHEPPLQAQAQHRLFLR